MSYEDRNYHLFQLSQVVVQDTIQYKLDKVADVYINGLFYFTVHRRYNSVYEYILEYSNGDTYLQKDNTIRNSLESVLCLSEKDSKDLYTIYGFSYKHNSSIDTIVCDVVDLTWSYLAKKCGAVSLNLGGILQDFHHTYEQYHHHADAPEVLQTPPPKAATTSRAPDAPLRPVPFDLVKEEEEKPENIVIELSLDQEPWSVLIPKGEASLRSNKRDRDWICYCEYNEEEEEQEEQEVSEEEEKQEQELDDANVTILRNGLRIPKINVSNGRSQQKQKQKQKKQKTY